MRLKITESKNSKSLYVIRSTYEKGKHSSEIIEKLGTYSELSTKLNGKDPIAWAKSYIVELNEKEKAGKRDVNITFSPVKRIETIFRPERAFNSRTLPARTILP